MTQGYNVGKAVQDIYVIIYHRDPSTTEADRSNFPTLHEKLHKYSLRKPQFEAGFELFSKTCYFVELNLRY